MDGITCPLTGDFNPISVDPVSGDTWTVSGPGAPAFGALVYDPDYKKIEQQARAKLMCGLGVREALSPYRGNLEFEEYVKKFDYDVGWSKEAPEFAGTACFPGDTYTLIEVVDGADQSLREARDLYAYLVVYVPEYRFRADPNYIGDPPDGFSEPLCGSTDKEDPDPVDPDYTGLVLDPVIDWCNFRARLQQSVREAANLRLLFGQQFMVDAMGLHFSGVEFVGGEDAVRQELAQLRAAKNQYELAERGLAEALGRAVGSGCYISDFYTQSEWSLLSRAIENQETAQHHIGTRLSYMNIATIESVPQAHESALQTFRQASVDGYIKLIGMASLGAAQPSGVGCDVGERPDGLLAAEMAANLVETRRQVNELRDKRNVFGFDVTFTPARLYKSSLPMGCDEAGAGDRGLWDEAWCAADYAEVLQALEVDNSREFDDTQQALRGEIQEIQANIDARIGAKSGCHRSDFSSDEEWYACVKDENIALRGPKGDEGCLAEVINIEDLDSDPDSVEYQFDNCMLDDAIKNGEAKQALRDLRAVYMNYQTIEKKVANIDERVKNSNDRKAEVEDWLWKSGRLETAANVSEVIYEAVNCIDFGTDSTWPSVAACGVGTAQWLAMESASGHISTEANVEIEKEENEEKIENILLDETELLIEAYATYQQFFSKKAEFLALLDGLERDLLEAQRARAYFQHSPANDPSFRMVRDSSRMVLAKQMAYASRMAYLAARRAEYEYAARLSASNFRISDIYRARTAQDIKRYLTSLQAVTNNLAGSATYQTNTTDFTISVAQHLNHWTDQALALEGFTDPAAAQAERVRRFREWAAEHTVLDPAISDKPVLKFSFTTSPLDGGLFSLVIQEGYDHYWLMKLSGIADPKPSNNGVRVNLVSDQTGLSYRSVALTQGGLVHLNSFAGCTFDYKLLAPAVLLGLEWASNQDPEVATAIWNANVNDIHDYTENGFRTPAFLGRSVSSTDWAVVVYSGAPVAGLPDMDLQQLTDLEIIFSTTYASRTPGEPELSECTRIDW